MYDIVENQRIARDIHRLVVYGDVSAFVRPGQFAEIAVPGKFLRRPISVCDWSDGRAVFIYKAVGEGTRILTGMTGGKLDLIPGLGNGFDPDSAGEQPLLVGGGVGTPPLYALAKALIARGKKVRAALGFGGFADVILETEFRALGAETTIVTIDRGVVTDFLPEHDSFFACGPEPMLRALVKKSSAPGELSLECRMGCGFGACMGCSIKTRDGMRRVCADGPVFKREALLW